MTDKGKVVQTVVTTETTTDYVNSSLGDEICKTLTFFNFGVILYIIYCGITIKSSKKNCNSNR